MRTTKPTSLLLLAPLAMTLGACANRPPEPTLAERQAALHSEFRELDRQKASLWREGFNRRKFEFDGVGTVEVLHWELQGWPGNTWVHARVNYTNTTDVVMSEAFIQFDVLDSKNRVRGSSAVRWINPAGDPWFPGHGYTGYIDIFTNGANEDPDGWGWAVDADAIVEEHPGPPPVLIDYDREAQRRAIERDSARRRYQRGSIRFAPRSWGSPHQPGQTRYGAR